MNSPSVKSVSECFIKPLGPAEESNQICNLTPWDIVMLSMHYIQKGLLFKNATLSPKKPKTLPLILFSLIATVIYSTLDITIFDILSPVDVPPIVHSFFDNHKAVNHDGHTMPLLSIKVTQLEKKTTCEHGEKDLPALTLCLDLSQKDECEHHDTPRPVISLHGSTPNHEVN
ncbi:hypothetical protein CR513_27649, partial [Mucuna pruriens]